MTENKKRYYRALGVLRETLAIMKKDIDKIDYELRNENIERAEYLISKVLDTDNLFVGADISVLKYLFMKLGDK